MHSLQHTHFSHWHQIRQRPRRRAAWMCSVRALIDRRTTRAVNDEVIMCVIIDWMGHIRSHCAHQMSKRNPIRTATRWNKHTRKWVCESRRARTQSVLRPQKQKMNEWMERYDFIFRFRTLPKKNHLLKQIAAATRDLRHSHRHQLNLRARAHTLARIDDVDFRIQNYTVSFLRVSSIHASFSQARNHHKSVEFAFSPVCSPIRSFVPSANCMSADIHSNYFTISLRTMCFTIFIWITIYVLVCIAAAQLHGRGEYQLDSSSSSSSHFLLSLFWNKTENRLQVNHISRHRDSSLLVSSFVATEKKQTPRRNCIWIREWNRERLSRWVAESRNVNWNRVVHCSSRWRVSRLAWRSSDSSTHSHHGGDMAATVCDTQNTMQQKRT